MAIKKTELYRILWESCDELRGGMDASQYKDYVLVFLFVRYVSDKAAADPNALITVPKGASFADMVRLKNDKEIGDKINKEIIGPLAKANDLGGVIDIADFNNESKLGRGKDMVERLTKLIAIFQNPALDFSNNGADGDDLLGDAYEYLMRHFATQSGKSKGQFYTPAEVSRVMAKVIGVSQAQSQDQTIYDPTCGSGSLLLKAADEAPRGVTIYGQENDNATAALASMNMVLHNNETAVIVRENTLSTPLFLNPEGTLKTFDFVVANPPFSLKSWKTGVNTEKDPHDRFEDGVPPAKYGDYAFLLHVIRSMKNNGNGAVIMPHGVLFRGNTEGVIRKNLIKRRVIKGIISLPPNLFYGTGISACIIVLDKAEAATRKTIFMIDASRGYMKDGNKNRLRHRDIRKIVDVFSNQLEISKYSRLVPLEEIAEKNDYNLNIPRYIDSSEPEDIQDIEAHLLGGIPQRDVDALETYWEVCPSLKDALFAPYSRPGYYEVRVPLVDIRRPIHEHPEFKAFQQTVQVRFNNWVAECRPQLEALAKGDQPRQLIQTLADSILKHFDGLHLIDRYDVYQHLMAYWVQTMQDDMFLIANEGWEVGRTLRKLKTAKELKEMKDKGEVVRAEHAELEVDKAKYRADLIPAALVIHRYFASEQQALRDLETAHEDLARQLEELKEEHGGDEGLLTEVINEKGNITKGDLNKRLKEIEGDAEFADELAVLQAYQGLLDDEAKADKAVMAAREALDAKTVEQYPKLTEADIRELVVGDKWIVEVQTAIYSDIYRISQALAERIRLLADRYESPLPVLQSEVAELTNKVSNHLVKMGFA